MQLVVPAFAGTTPRVRKKFALNPQHHLRNNIALDLRGAAEDRVGAAVEIFRYHRQHLLRHRRLMVEPVERAHRLDPDGGLGDHLRAQAGHGGASGPSTSAPRRVTAWRISLLRSFRIDDTAPGFCPVCNADSTRSSVISSASISISTSEM